MIVMGVTNCSQNSYKAHSILCKHNLFFIAEWYSILCACVYFCIYSFTDRDLGIFHNLAIVNVDLIYMDT